MRPEGIEAVKPLSNSKCLKYSAGTVPSTTATTESTTATTMTTTESTTTTTVLTMASTTESVTTTEATTTSAKECRKGYDQCGGKGYTGNTCCIYGWDCIVQNEFYFSVPADHWNHHHSPIGLHRPGNGVCNALPAVWGSQLEWPEAQWMENGWDSHPIAKLVPLRRRGSNM